MTSPSATIPSSIDQDWRDDAIWAARLKADRIRAKRNQTAAQRTASTIILGRALELGAKGVALTGSTARARRTAISDLDIHIVGPRPRFQDLSEGLDLYVTSTEVLWDRLRDGDDFIQWTVRYGCILVDHGVFREALIHIAENSLWPDPNRKHDRAEELLSFAERIVATGDLDAAQEQTRAALTTVARWLLLANREFPLSRDELSDQVLDLGCFDLAAALSRLIHAEPCLDELATAIQIGRLVISLPPHKAKRAALAR